MHRGKPNVHGSKYVRVTGNSSTIGLSKSRRLLAWSLLVATQIHVSANPSTMLRPNANFRVDGWESFARRNCAQAGGRISQALLRLATGPVVCRCGSRKNSAAKQIQIQRKRRRKPCGRIAYKCPRPLLHGQGSCSATGTESETEPAEVEGSDFDTKEIALVFKGKGCVEPPKASQDKEL